MRITIATPLYPPDIAMPAPYVKELAKRLSKEHEVTIVTYGQYPETIEGVRIIAVSKQRPLPIRLFLYTLVLMRTTRRSDWLYALNGASVELPAGLVASLTRTPLIAHIGDTAAHERAGASSLLGRIERFFVSQAQSEVTGTPLDRPEILPLEPFPADSMKAYEASWTEHLAILKKTLAYA